MALVHQGFRADPGLSCLVAESPASRNPRDRALQLFNVEGGITTVAGQLIAGHGDSGGPVWTPINGFDQPTSAADARGLISSRPDGWADIAWATTPVSNQPNTCSTAMWFTDIVSAIGPWVSKGGTFVKTG
jgi:hypothetical protein